MSSKHGSVPSPSSFKMGLSLFVGVIIGILLQRNFSQPSQIRNSFSGSSQSVGALREGNGPEVTVAQVQRGMVKKLQDVPERPTSHVDTDGRPITKQQFLEPFVVPNFVGFSVATFLPGQTLMPLHEHDSLHEFFYVLDGTGYFQIDDEQYEVSKGTFLHMAPHEKHGMWVPKDSENGALKLALCGVTVD